MFGSIAFKELIKHPLVIFLFLTTLAGAGVSVWKWIGEANCHTQYQKLRADTANDVNQQIYTQMKLQAKQNRIDAQHWMDLYQKQVKLNDQQASEAAKTSRQVTKLQEDLKHVYAQLGAHNCANINIPTTVRQRVLIDTAPPSASSNSPAHNDHGARRSGTPQDTRVSKPAQRRDMGRRTIGTRILLEGQPAAEPSNPTDKG